MAELTEAQRAKALMLSGQLGKCRAWITGYEAGSGKTVVNADSLRVAQLFFEEIAKTLASSSALEGR